MPFNRRSQAFVNLQVEREHGLGLDPNMAYASTSFGGEHTGRVSANALILVKAS